ncbi:uncharacterized protein [Nicotiana tomentosiformis]|uniref:uncharacterized protein n=1 Tax=Nicotiana tomentosiformis TaxID=4098 RepID=UPI00051B986C|nr:uncharacterized protein LOC104089911 [Nicotiana tomentosiformis]
MGGGIVVSTTAFVPTQEDPLTMAARFRRNKKKGGYVSACYRCIRKRKEHPGRANTGGMQYHAILFDKYLSSYIGKVGMRYFNKRQNLIKKKGNYVENQVFDKSSHINEIELQCRFDNKESLVVHIDGRNCGVLNETEKFVPKEILTVESEKSVDGKENM